MKNKHGILFTGRLGNNLYALLNGLCRAKKEKKEIYFYNEPDNFGVYRDNIFRNYVDIEIEHPNEDRLTNRNAIDALCKKENLSSFQSIYFGKNMISVDSLNDFVKTIGPTPEIVEKIKSKYNDICNMVSFHVRRGDYLYLPGYWTVDSKYCNDSINILKQKLNINKLSLLVFSDDIEWCKNNLNVDDDVQFFDSSCFENDAYDLYAMSLCKHNIIANSTFSQWASYLNENTDKLCVYPKKDKDGKSIIPFCEKYFEKIKIEEK